MKSRLQLLTSWIFVLGLSLGVGCAGSNDGEDVNDDVDASEQSPSNMLPEFTEDIATLYQTTTVDVVDCSICATAQTCCNAVSTRTSYCASFNAERCETLDPGRQRTTKLNCLTLLRTTLSAWTTAGRTPPSQCRIPGE
jgi:hypothetical protein